MSESILTDLRSEDDYHLQARKITHDIIERQRQKENRDWINKVLGIKPNGHDKDPYPLPEGK